MLLKHFHYTLSLFKSEVIETKHHAIFCDISNRTSSVSVTRVKSTARERDRLNVRAAFASVQAQLVAVISASFS